MPGTAGLLRRSQLFLELLFALVQSLQTELSAMFGAAVASAFLADEAGLDWRLSFATVGKVPRRARHEHEKIRLRQKRFTDYPICRIGKR